MAAMVIRRATRRASVSGWITTIPLMVTMVDGAQDTGSDRTVTARSVMTSDAIASAQEASGQRRERVRSLQFHRARITGVRGAAEVRADEGNLAGNLTLTNSLANEGQRMSLLPDVMICSAASRLKRTLLKTIQA